MFCEPSPNIPVRKRQLLFGQWSPSAFRPTYPDDQTKASRFFPRGLGPAPPARRVMNCLLGNCFCLPRLSVLFGQRAYSTGIYRRTACVLAVPAGNHRRLGNRHGGGAIGYLYFIQSPWHLPLFYVSALGTPAGTNVIFMDVVPIVALIGKPIHSLTGATVNLYGGYLFVCFVLPGVMMTLVLIAARIHYALPR